MYVCMYVCMHVCMYVCMYVQNHICFMYSATVELATIVERWPYIPGVERGHLGLSKVGFHVFMRDPTGHVCMKVRAYSNTSKLVVA